MPFPPASPTVVPPPTSPADHYLDATNIQIDGLRQQVAVMEQQIAMMSMMLCYDSETLCAIRDDLDALVLGQRFQANPSAR